MKNYIVTAIAATLPLGSILVLDTDQIGRRTHALSSIDGPDALAEILEVDVDEVSVLVDELAAEVEEGLIPVRCEKSVQFKRGEKVRVLKADGINKALFADMAEEGTAFAEAVEAEVAADHAHGDEVVESRAAEAAKQEELRWTTKGAGKKAPDESAAGTASKTAQALAEKNGIDISTISGTGRGGAVTVADVKAALPAAGTAAAETAAAVNKGESNLASGGVVQTDKDDAQTSLV